MTYKLLNNIMDHLTRTKIIKQDAIYMDDGSEIAYCMEITLQADEQDSIAYQKIKDITHRQIIEPIELEIVHMFSDCPDDDDSNDEDSDLDMNLPAYLPADEDPDEDPEDLIG